jgi:hypothetical protein
MNSPGAALRKSLFDNENQAGVFKTIRIHGTRTRNALGKIEIRAGSCPTNSPSSCNGVKASLLISSAGA